MISGAYEINTKPRKKWVAPEIRQAESQAGSSEEDYYTSSVGLGGLRAWKILEKNTTFNMLYRVLPQERGYSTENT